MSSHKLQSFEDFAKANTVAKAAKLEEEQSAKRDASADQFKSILSEFGATTIKELTEEDRTKFFAALSASEVSESIAVIEEGTRSQIGKIKKNGKISAVYMHYDGYPDHMLPTIKKGYKDGKAVDLLLKKGGGSGLAANVDDIKFYGDKTTTDGNMKDTEKFVKDAANNGGAEFIYLYSERDSKWYMVDIYNSYDLVPAFESMMINEKFVVSKGNLRDAKKVAKWLESFFTNHTALMDGPLLLGVCKYLLAESLTDANFHRYRDPVSKKIGGKITTITVEIDKLGGQQIPVSKKSIMNLLDEHYSGLANAAGWSGIGIVEGMALFLDGFGHSKIAEAITAEFNLIYANESAVTEGNAFLAARAKAIEEDAEEFEFNGKNFPVIKEDAEAETVEEGKASQALAAIELAKELEEDEVEEGRKTVDSSAFGDDKLGYNDQFRGNTSLSQSLASDLGFNPKKPWSEGLGFDDQAMYSVGKPEGTIANDALSGKYTYAELLAMAKDYFGMKESHHDKEEVEETEEVTEAKFVKDFDKGVLDAEYKADITTYYPSAKFFIGKMTHFFGELEPNLYFKAYYAKYYKEDTGNKIDGEFKITSIYSEKGSKYVNLYVESADTVEAPKVNEAKEYKAGDTVELKTGEIVEINQVVKGPKAELNTYRAKVKGKQIDFSLTDINESKLNEAEVKSDEDFKEYAFAVLQKAFGEDFDEAKAQEVVDGLLSKHGEEYGAAIGALTASLG